MSPGASSSLTREPGPLPGSASRSLLSSSLTTGSRRARPIGWSAIADAARSSDASPLVLGLEGVRATLELTFAEGAGARPLVLMTPPSDGTFAARYIAARYARRGIHAAVIVQEDDVFLDPALDAAGVERKLRASVVAARTVLAALSRRADVDASRVTYFGISAGGIFGAVLLAVEPRVARAALVFPGGDLPALILASDDGGVRDYRESWFARGFSRGALREALAREVKTDPLLLARHVDPARVLVFLSDEDTTVPIEGGLALRDALGKPETWILSGNHETAGFCFGFVLGRADDFLLGESR
ncbi:hypothetical protein HY251_17660 [bacterium]|nr:hypothetical protein [bacterium]